MREQRLAQVQINQSIKRDIHEEVGLSKSRAHQESAVRQEQQSVKKGQ